MVEIDCGAQMLGCVAKVKPMVESNNSLVFDMLIFALMTVDAQAGMGSTSLCHSL